MRPVVTRDPPPRARFDCRRAEDLLMWRGELGAPGIRQTAADRPPHSPVRQRTEACGRLQRAGCALESGGSATAVDLQGLRQGICRAWRSGQLGAPGGFSRQARFRPPQRQLFGRVLARSGLPRIRLHAPPPHPCLAARRRRHADQVVTERVGHAKPTMHTYQHLLPGMSADAAARSAGSSLRQPVGTYRPAASTAAGQKVAWPAAGR